MWSIESPTNRAAERSSEEAQLEFHIWFQIMCKFQEIVNLTVDESVSWSLGTGCIPLFLELAQILFWIVTWSNRVLKIDSKAKKNQR